MANLSLAFCALLWGSMFPTFEYMLQRFDALSLAAARVTFGAVTVLLVMFLRQGLRAIPRGAPWGRIVLLGTCGLGVSSGLTSFAVATSSAVATAIVAAASPVVAALMSRLLLGAGLAPRVQAAVVLAVAGGVLVAWGRVRGGLEVGGGELLMLAGSIAWTWYLIRSPAWLAGLDSFQVTAYTTAVAAAALTLAAVLAGWLVPGFGRADLSLPAMPWIAYMGLVSIGFTVMLWQFAIRRVGVPVAGIVYNAVPVVSVLVAVVWLGARPSAWQIGGGALILAGVLWCQIPARRRRPEAGP